MIVYGAILNSFTPLYGGTPFTFYGAITERLEQHSESSTIFPIYGAITQQVIAPNKFKQYGALLKVIQAPSKFVVYGAVNKVTAKNVNLSGLSISAIAKSMIFTTPSYRYNIYPYHVNDVYKITGATDYQIVGTELVCRELPTGPVVIIPFERLCIAANEVRLLTVINTIPARAEFKNITISSNSFKFSLDGITWNQVLQVIDKFYVKAPDMLIDGVDFTKEITVQATVYPKG